MKMHDNRSALTVMRQEDEYFQHLSPGALVQIEARKHPHCRIKPLQPESHSQHQLQHRAAIFLLDVIHERVQQAQEQGSEKQVRGSPVPQAGATPATQHDAVFMHQSRLPCDFRGKILENFKNFENMIGIIVAGTHQALRKRHP